MASGRRRTKFVRILLSLILLLLVVIVALPWWFPWVLRPAAKRWGGTYTDYHRHGYARFDLTHFSFTNRAGTFSAERVEATVPTVWLWRHFAGPKSGQFVEVNSWQYVSSTNNPSRPRRPPYATFQKLKTSAATLQSWLPSATLTNGIVLIRNHRLEISQATWKDGKLSGQLAIATNTQPLQIIATVARETPWQLAVEFPALKCQSTVSIDDHAGGLQVGGTVYWLSNRLDVEAVFSRDSFLPSTASIRADAFQIPATLLKLEDYRNFTGAVRADWNTNRFTVDLTAKALPDSTNAPPIDIVARASGDTNIARIDSLKLSAPGVTAELTPQTEVLFHPPFLSRPTVFRVNANLEQQPWVAVRGNLTGETVLRPNDQKFPQLSFSFSGSDVTFSNVSLKSAQLEGVFLWPRLELTAGRLTTDDGADLLLTGAFDVRTKSIENGRLQGSGAFGKQFLPAGYSFRSATIDTRCDGPLRALTNSGTLDVQGLSVPHANPMHVQAAWTGHGTEVSDLQLTAAAGNSSLRLRGSAAFGPGAKQLAVTVLDLVRGDRTEMQLQQPFQITFRKASTTTPANSWSIAMEPMIWSGTDREIRLSADVQWPQQGTFQAMAHGLESGLIQEFIRDVDSIARLDTLAFSGGWTNGPVSFRLESKAGLQTREQLSFSANADVTGDADGILIRQLFISSATNLVCRAEGSLAVVLEPGRRDGLLHIHPNAPLQFNVRTEPNSVLWEKLSAVSGIKLQKPDLTAELKGTWFEPQGNIRVQAQRIEWPHGGHPLPAVENVAFFAELDRKDARISKCEATVEGQPISLTAQVPLGESFWAGLKNRKRLPDWREATAHLKIENAQLSAFADYLPEMISPEGTATADISLERDAQLHGGASIAGARTRPFESIGSVRNIQAKLVFTGRTLQVADVSADIGGQRVNGEGEAQLSEELLRTNTVPPFSVRLHGTNVPLARNPTILLRADFDLAVTNSGVDAPVIVGDVRLRDSLFLADLQSLVPERAAAPRLRPPYFSVELKPWSDWRLRANVHGDGFLRVQTPLFHGKASTSLRLEGTLKDPIALGQAKIDSGRVTFPFGSLDVKQGLVSLTSENPYRPQLFVTAGAQRFGYDIRMEATGPADHPIVQFSSTPGLSSEQIVLMLTTGQVPRGVGITSSTGQRAQGLALFVGKNLMSEFGIGGSGDERLSIRSGEQISESGRPTYELEYKLSDRWSVVGEYDRFDQYNLNLKWKVYSK